jgi:hypothetical protein
MLRCSTTCNDEGLSKSQTAPSHPVILVWKKNGYLRFCTDYKKLDDVIRKDCFPLPQINDILETLAEAKWFSTLNLRVDIGRWICIWITTRCIPD